MAAKLSPTLIRTLSATFLGISSLAAIAGIATNSFHLGARGGDSSGGSASGGYASAVRASARPLVVDGGFAYPRVRGDAGGSFLNGSGAVAPFGDSSFPFPGDGSRSSANRPDWANRFDDYGFNHSWRGDSDAPPWAPPSPPSGFGGWPGDHAGSGPDNWNPQWWVQFGGHSGPQLPSTPEPQVVSLLVLGAAMIGIAVRRRRRLGN